AVFFIFFVNDKPVKKEERIKSKYFDFWKGAPSSYKTLLSLLTVFSIVNSSDVFLILKSQHILHSAILAIVGYILYNIVYAVTSYPMGKLSDLLGKRKVFAGGLSVFSVVYLGFALVDNIFFIYGLFLLYGLYAASTEGIAKAWISDLIPDNMRGTAIGLLTMLSSFAAMIGSLLAGILWDQFGSRVPFLFSFVISFAIAVFFILMKDNE
ncbi:MAG TPA: MFS transporter, partial [Ignavibacteria bacterium]|nr:MFS transporter [Ignavibacteria bacterium]